jgi:hypothetical protein
MNATKLLNLAQLHTELEDRLHENDTCSPTYHDREIGKALTAAIKRIARAGALAGLEACDVTAA